MALWFVLALMTVAAAFAVLLPLGRARVATGPATSEIDIYRDQLDEIGRDVQAQRIGEADAQAARLEVSRRLLAADAAAHDVATSSPVLRRAVSLVALIALPFAAAAIYLALGSPGLPAFPLAGRQVATDLASAPMTRLVAQVEAHLEKNPDDGRGWDVLAPVLLRLGRSEDAARAFRNALAKNGESAQRQADLGEALAMAAGGVVTAEAKSAFDRALALDARETKARYFAGLAAMQDGRRDAAISAWRALLSDAPPDAPWRGAVQDALATAIGGSAGPGSNDIAAAEKLAPDARNAMVRGMVEGLAAKLKADGADPQGWLRLVRAYMVLGDEPHARAAVADARSALSADAARLKQLDDGLKDLGVKDAP
jgi:cytochrome c-type biogenesis protein CcmH